MATTNDGVKQVSIDLGDYWQGTTTGAGSATTLVDTALIDEDDNQFPTPRAQFHMLSGAASGETAGFDTKSGATLTVKSGRDLSAASGSGSSYEVHRIFTRQQKEDALTRALNQIFPVLFVVTQEELTIVANQLLYTMTNYTWRNQPTSIALQSSSDTEIENPIINWSVNANDDKLRLRSLPESGRKIIVEGITPPAITDLTDEHLQILSAWAALDLANGAKRGGPTNERSHWEAVIKDLKIEFADRRARFGPVAPAAQLRSTVYSKGSDRSWGGI
jgi:hypothetical protein